MTKIISHLIIVGVGLLGSSIALAAKRRGIVDTVTGIDCCREMLNIALRREAVDVVSTEIDILANINNGLAVICTPVRTIISNVERITSAGGNFLFSDVGSTKANICRELERRGVRFVGAHPIAGSEKSGAEFGNADLFQGCLTVLTPTDSNRSEDIDRLQLFWETLGSRVTKMEPEQHDEVLAKTSHLPHAVAAALASLLTESERPFCGTGFADMTRIASGSSAIWTDIFLDNRSQLLVVLEQFGDRLAILKTALQNDDATAVVRFLESGNRVPAKG